jgi:cytoskeletal protein CcmA (bactofilin family)
MEPEKFTVIDAEADLQGKLHGKDARILGKFQGEIELSGRLHVGEGARLDARVKADSAEIAGEYQGDVVARHLVLLERARVSGTFSAEILSVRDGAQVNGTVTAGAAAKAPKGPGGAAG